MTRPSATSHACLRTTISLAVLTALCPPAALADAGRGGTPPQSSPTPSPTPSPSVRSQVMPRQIGPLNPMRQPIRSPRPGTDSTGEDQPVFQPGYLISVTSNVQVFDVPSPANVRRPISQEPAGSEGTIVGGPIQDNGRTLWQAHFRGSDVTGWLEEAALTALARTGAEIGVYALIVRAAPALAGTPVHAERVTPPQALALKTALAELRGKRLVVLHGRVALLDEHALQITQANDVVSMTLVGNDGARHGSVVLADLAGLHTPELCNPDDPWYDYVYCELDNRAKAAPGASFGDDAALIATITAYLDTRFTGVGGFEQNFDLVAKGTRIAISPKAANRLTGLEKDVAMTFANEPSVYDQRAIVEEATALKERIETGESDIVYIASDDLLDAMSVGDLEGLMAPEHMVVRKSTRPETACTLPPEPTCYREQAGSVIPCNTQIDWVDGFKDIISIRSGKFYGILKRLERLGYAVKRIKNDQYGWDGIAFLKALVSNTGGQVLVLGFHGSEEVVSATPGILTPTTGGDIYPLGCVEERLAGPGGEFERRLQHDPGVMCLFKPNQFSMFWKKGYGCPSARGGSTRRGPAEKPPVSYVGWGVKLSDLRINEKAIEAGFPCHEQLDALEQARATYLNPPELSSAFGAEWDLIHFVSYLSGYGPTSGAFESKAHYEKYPPDFPPHNLNVGNIDDLGGPCLLESERSSCTRKGPWSTKKVPNNEGQIVEAQIPTTWQPKIQLSDAHLFPYVTRLDPEQDGTEFRIRFSDEITNNPKVEFTVNGKPAIASLQRDSGNQLTARLIPEVEVVDALNYASYVATGKDRGIPKAMLIVSGARAKANDIEMVGNPLARYTAEDGDYRIAYFPYNRYFWHYNARATGGELHAFKAAIPYKLHPFVGGVSLSDTQPTTVAILLSKEVLSPSPDASPYVRVDASACTSGGPTFAKDGTPAFVNMDGANGSEAIRFTLAPEITVFSGRSSRALKVTVSGLRSYWNQLPLLGNTRSSSKWLWDADQDGLKDVWAGNSDQFPQVEGNFEVWIPCFVSSPSPAPSPPPLSSVGSPARQSEPEPGWATPQRKSVIPQRPAAPAGPVDTVPQANSPAEVLVARLADLTDLTQEALNATDSGGGPPLVLADILQDANTAADRALLAHAIGPMIKAGKDWLNNTKNIIISAHVPTGARAAIFHDGRPGYIVLHRASLGGDWAQTLISLAHEGTHQNNAGQGLSNRQDEVSALQATVEGMELAGTYPQAMINAQRWFADRMADDEALSPNRQPTPSQRKQVFAPYGAAVRLLSHHLKSLAQTLVYVSSHRLPFGLGYTIVFRDKAGREYSVRTDSKGKHVTRLK